MPSEQHEMMVGMMQARPSDATTSVEDMRAAYDALGDLYPLADDIEVEQVDAGGVPADWVAAPNADPTRTLLYLHGGGYVIGSRKSHRELASRLSRAAQARVLLLDYRRAPESPFPAAIEDATASYRWLLGQGADPARVAIGGDSAGGGLTMSALLSLRDAGVTLPAAAILLSPWIDLEATGDSSEPGVIDDPICRREELRAMAEQYAPGDKLADPLLSPLQCDLAGLPPCLIQVGTREALLDDATRLADRLQAAGVSVELEQAQDLIHVYQQFVPSAPETVAAVEQLGSFIRNAT